MTNLNVELEDGRECVISDRKRGDCVYVSKFDGTVKIRVAHIEIEVDKDGEITFNGGDLLKEG
jgi:hypothetical protein